MANPEHVEIVRQGRDAIAAFRKEHPDVQLDLGDVDLKGIDLSGADLSRALLSNTILRAADLKGANMRGINVNETDMSHAELIVADLTDARLVNVNLNGADLRAAKLVRASVWGTDLIVADLTDADLSSANFASTTFRTCSISDMLLEDATFEGCTFSNLNLGDVRGLENVMSVGPSSVDTHTLRASKGKIPDSFLRGVGFSPWEVLNAKLYDPLLTREQIAEINNEIFQKRVGNPVGGIFISYSHADTEFVEGLHAALGEKEYSVWRDVHDLVAGPLERQIFEAIRINAVVLLVLSEDSVRSDWVEGELARARDKERSEGRPVLCPIALDPDWEAKLPDDADTVLWRTVKKKAVLDFSAWDQRGFDDAFAKLLKGLPIYYGVPESVED